MKTVIARGSIYVLLAVLTVFGGWFERLEPNALDTLTWLDWVKVSVAAGVAGLIALRSYIDGSFERLQQLEKK